ncbi:hypothetical protein FB565_006500 [Actinoplanes lutulentus]|uniref:Uncharacterized protein n=1 Tax=Actinoplanes lutulentus TaxID=1287878 RepID=A0A327ZAA3_9ACTN|nr:hypothetical protein [Actinoplanes lutulentus]MBB2946732.1 hypothetical protein [Actinoplanes lutulentus]RAK35624.1 hypothetical protein B0I29_10997 [Actinoplanes lutulentus]
MRVFESDEYLPDYGLLVLRDPDVAWERAPALPREHDSGVEPAGTFAGAGAGWIMCQASGNEPHRVRLELHDTPPKGSDGDGFGGGDVAELPYLACSGGLVLTWLTGGVGPADFDLGSGGDYRVRICSAPIEGGGFRWLLQFWPVSDIALPVWLRRSRPAVGPGNSGWITELGYELMELAGIVRATADRLDGLASAEQVDAWGREHLRPEGWLDQPVWPLPRTPLPTGHADLDKRNAAQHAEVAARLNGQQSRLDEIAAELGVPRVARKRDAFALLAAAGVLVAEAPGRYRVGEPARVDTVLALSAKQARMIRQQDARSRFGSVAEDVELVLRWSPRMPLSVTAGELAARLLMPEADLGGALRFAEESGLLWSEPVSDGGELRLWMGRRPEPEPQPGPTVGSRPAAAQARSGPTVGSRPAAAQPQPEPTVSPGPAAAQPQPEPTVSPWPAGSGGSGGNRRLRGSVRMGAMVRFTFNAPVGVDPFARRDRPEPPIGAPPKAGIFLADGTLVTGSDRVPTESARPEAAPWTRAMQTARGILVAGPGRMAELIAADGGMREIPGVRGTGLLLLSDGHRIAVADNGQLSIVDLFGGPTIAMPSPEERLIGLIGVHGETIYFGDGRGSTMCWTPGGAPRAAERAFQQIDPISGIGLIRSGQGVIVVRPGRPDVTVPVDLAARLAPGGERLWTVRTNPSALTLFAITPEVEPQVFWLPDGSYRAPIWEDAEHVLFGVEPWHFMREPTAGIRLSLRDGSVERLPTEGRMPAIIVEPR